MGFLIILLVAVLGIAFVSIQNLRERLRALEVRLGRLEDVHPRPGQVRNQQLEFAPPAVEPSTLDDVVVGVGQVEEGLTPNIAAAANATAEFRPSPDFVPPSETAESAVSDEETVEKSGFQRLRGGLTFEDLFGRKLPIWAGGVTLAIAGFLIVKYSIDTGLLSPFVRVVLGVIFGLSLICGAEAAHRFRSVVRDLRIGQALAGAGAATLYGSVLVAANLYGLIGPEAAFFALAAITALALGLALRFGAPCALLALLGGFAAPLFVGSADPNLPLLTLYLGMTVGGLATVARAQGWSWLGYAALAGGLLWSGALIVTGPSSLDLTLAIGAYLVLLGIAMPLLAFSGRSRIRAGVGTVVSAIQVAALVAHNGFTPLDWALFSLISVGLQWISRRETGWRMIRPAGFATALLLLAAWPSPSFTAFALAMLAMLIIHGGPALYDLWRRSDGMVEAIQLAVAAIAVWLLPFLHFQGWIAGDGPLALLALAGCAMAAGFASLGWGGEARNADLRFPLLVAASACCAIAAAVFGVSQWLLPAAVAAVAAAVLVIAVRADDRRVELTAWIALMAALVLALILPAHWDGLLHPFGWDRDGGWRSTLVLLMLGGVAAGFAHHGRIVPARLAAQAIAALLAYGGLAQPVPVVFLPLLSGALLVVLAGTCRWIAPLRVAPGLAALSAVTLLWTLQPLLHWLVVAIASPVLVTGLPSVEDALLRMAVPAFAVGVVLASLRNKIPQPILSSTVGSEAWNSRDLKSRPH